MVIAVATVAIILLTLVAIYDLTQRQHAILRNFPVVGHFRYWLEAVGPELRQYIVTDNDEERPFSRDQRRWVYASAKRENNYFGFGSDNEMELQPNYLIIKHDTFPLRAPHPGDPASIRSSGFHARRCSAARAGAARPSDRLDRQRVGDELRLAERAGRRGAQSRRQIAGCLQSTGEGGVSSHHLQGGDLVWQVGTGYFGCREPDGRFSMAKLKDTIARVAADSRDRDQAQSGRQAGRRRRCCRARRSPARSPTSAASRWTAIASARPRTARSGTPTRCSTSWSRSPSETGLPVGIKSAVGDSAFWEDLATLMAGGARGVDFITIDGGEGGTGAGPLVFTDHVALPFKVGFSRVQRIFTDTACTSDRLHRLGQAGLPRSGPCSPSRWAAT